uniref:AlNc14C521G12033 protein n=1 Tax=Albugo laibachii Nc14 TaxID=890382 RepID=F0X0T9_9STRA|nr:AlNc14C521G12033 [Albugo laibachii Nc14]|eukprot:CCA27384.1 AlNc14C521G12033 [Albugo laibachii Nc14]
MAVFYVSEYDPIGYETDKNRGKTEGFLTEVYTGLLPADSYFAGIKTAFDE